MSTFIEGKVIRFESKEHQRTLLGHLAHLPGIAPLHGQWPPSRRKQDRATPQTSGSTRNTRVKMKSKQDSHTHTPTCTSGVLHETNITYCT